MSTSCSNTSIATLPSSAAEWKHVKNILRGKTGQYEVVCTYCDKPYHTSGVTRIRAHLLSSVGFGISGCAHVPDEVLSFFKALEHEKRVFAINESKKRDFDDLTSGALYTLCILCIQCSE